MPKTIKVIFALLLCACMAAGVPVNPISAYASLADEEYADIDLEEDGDFDEESSEEDEQDDVEAQYSDRIDQINDQIAALEEKNKQIQAGINATTGEKEQKQAEANAIGAQISITQDEIALLMQRIDYYEEDIASTYDRIEKKEKDIEKKQAEIDLNYDILRKRLRASYMQDTTTTLGLIFGSDNFSDFLSRVEYMQRVAQHDRKLLADLGVQRQGLEAQKLSLEEEMAKLEEFKRIVEEDKSNTEKKKQDLSVKISRVQSEVQNLEEMERAYRADLATNKKIQEAAKAELDKIYREIEWSKNAYAGGAMAWPLPAYTIPGNGYVSCEVGPRFGGTDYHTGIDISGGGIHGSNIVAVNDGVIVKANWANTKGVGYGIYVMIDHGVNENGQSVSTLYAHMSNISVQEGQSVKRGQVIGQVGSTGWSTGPHLHFEVRLNGSWTNPRPYLFG